MRHRRHWGCVAISWAFVVLTAISVQAADENWPCWRGPRGDGSSHEAGLPLHWSGEENVKWKTEIPGIGHASPVVWQDRVFVVSCILETEERVLFCLDRDGGEIRWRKTVLKSPLEKKHQLNSYASSTPATDGKHVYVAFLDQTQMRVAAFDFAGNLEWECHPGVFSSVHGFCSCPVIFEDLLIVNGDHDGESYVVALDRASGETRWKVKRVHQTRSYCTPIIREIDGRTQMIMSGSKQVVSYDPRTGKEHWRLEGPTEQFVASMVDRGNHVFLTAGFPEYHILAIAADGHGDVSNSHVVWRTTDNCAYVPSPVLVNDCLVVVSDNGVATCRDAATGELHWKKRIGDHFSGSLVSAEGNAWFLADSGRMTIVKVGPEYELVATNELGEPCFSSPALSQGHVFLRGENHLYCIGP